MDIAGKSKILFILYIFFNKMVISKICIIFFSISRPPSVRVDHGYSILIVCLAGASAAMTVKANA